MTDTRQFKLYGPNGELLMSGSRSAVTEPILDSVARADAYSLKIDAIKARSLMKQQKVAADQLRQRQFHAFCDSVTTLGRRLDTLEQQRAKRARREAEDEARRIQAKLDALPDPDDPSQYPQPQPLLPAAISLNEEPSHADDT
jgi:hypothetical protein